MQNLIQWIEKERSKKPSPSQQQLLNLTREYLQILVLKSIFHSKWGNCLSFMGGTCLRICYDLRRFSEDLDFTLDRGKENYSFDGLLKTIQRNFEKNGFKIETTSSKEGVVQKSFIKLGELLQPLGLSARKGEKIHIKLEVDMNPIPVSDDQRESFFVGKFNESFPIIKHKMETLFSGKILALLSRTYAKGRDYYDLIWYLTRKTPIDMRYLMDGVLQANRQARTVTPLPQFKNAGEVLNSLAETVAKADLTVILKDIGRFLEDPAEEKWIKNYSQAFSQLAASYLSPPLP